MTDLLFTATMCITAMIVMVFLLIYWIRNKKEHPDFIMVLILLVIFQLTSVLATYYTVADVIDYKFDRVVIENGMCDIAYIENRSSRFSEPENFIQITIDHIKAEGKAEDFENVQPGTFPCEMKYTKTSQILLELKLQ